MNKETIAKYKTKYSIKYKLNQIEVDKIRKSKFLK